MDAGWDEFDHLGVVAAHPEASRARTGRPSDGVDRRDFQRVFEHATARWTSGEHDADYPEPYPASSRRVRGRASTGPAPVAGPGGTVLVVSSWAARIAAACAAPGRPRRRTTPRSSRRLWARFNTVIVNSSFTRVVVGSTGPRLLTFNEHPHLEGDHLTYR